MKKPLKNIIIMALILVLSGCGSSKNETTASSEDENKITIITTIYPIYNWMEEIIGNNNQTFDLSMLIDNGIDFHSYQPSMEDILEISQCDVFVYVGGETDEWVEEILAEALNPNMKIIKLLDVLGDNAKKEEIVEGMEEEHEEEHEDEHDEEALDEHIWLSIKNAEFLVNELTTTISSLDGKKEIYEENASSYVNKLKELDAKYENAIDLAKKDVLVFADRFPFRYLVDDYNLNYYAAFVGCSAETEASFETIAFLSNKIDEYDLNNVVILENSNPKLAETVINNSKNKTQEILVMDSIQSISPDDINNGVTYISIMEKNLNALVKALE